MYAGKSTGGSTPDSPPLHVAIGHLILENLEGFQQGMAAHGEEILADVPNYTNIALQVQISEMQN